VVRANTLGVPMVLAWQDRRLLGRTPIALVEVVEVGPLVGRLSALVELVPLGAARLA